MGNDMLFINGSFPRAIVHIDGDAFFTSVEQSMNLFSERKTCRKRTRARHHRLCKL